MSNVILLPRLGGNFLQQEECCWGRNSKSVPALPFHLSEQVGANHTGLPAQIVPMDLDPSVPFPSPGFIDRFYLPFSWIFGDLLEPYARRLLETGKELTLIANPAGALWPLTEKFPGATIIPAGAQFRTDGPLPWDALDPIHWGAFSAATVQFSSGCTHGCRFCVWGDQPRKLRNPGQVTDDIHDLIARVPQIGLDRTGRSLYLLGNELTGQSAWLIEFITGLPSGLAWSSDINVCNATLETIGDLAAAGLKRVCMGIEFLTNDMLFKLGKGHDVADAFRVMSWLQEENIAYTFSLRQGVGETPTDLRQMLRYLEEMRARGLKPEHIYIASMVNWPGRQWLPVPALAEPHCYNVGTAAYPIWAQRLPEESLELWKEVHSFCRKQGWMKPA